MMAYLSDLTTMQHGLLALLLALTVAKILSTAVLVVMGDYRAARISPSRRFAGITSKVTPVLMALTAGLLAFARGNQLLGWLLIAATPFVAGFAAFVLRLRSRGSFYGGADWLERHLTPRQTKGVLLVFLGALLIYALRSL